MKINHYPTRGVFIKASLNRAPRAEFHPAGTRATLFFLVRRTDAGSWWGGGGEYGTGLGGSFGSRKFGIVERESVLGIAFFQGMINWARWNVLFGFWGCI